MNLFEKIFKLEKRDYRKIIHILGFKINLPKDNVTYLENKILELEFRIKNYIANSEVALMQDLKNNLISQNECINNLLKVSKLHQETFLKYRNINQGKDVVLIATGPSLKDFKPIENAIYVGVNRAFEYDKVKFDYLFLQDYSGATIEYIENFANYDAKKFMGYIPHYISTQCLIPEKYSFYPNVERYFVSHPTERKSFTFDISNQPLGDAYSIAFPAMQFILWTNPKRIYLVGCDCNQSGYHDAKIGANNLAVDEVLDAWKRMKDFASAYYPDTEIISINPIGLKGLYKDEFQGE